MDSRRSREYADHNVMPSPVNSLNDTVNEAIGPEISGIQSV